MSELKQWREALNRMEQNALESSRDIGRALGIEVDEDE